MTPKPRTKTAKPEVTMADVKAAETVMHEAAATFDRLRRKEKTEAGLTAADIKELRGATSALQKVTRLFGRAVREHAKRRGDC